MWKRKVRTILRSQLERARSEATPPTQFSMRDLAKKLELSSGALSELLSGKRKLSPNIAKKLVTKMTMSETERADLLREMEPRLPLSEKLGAQEIIDLICNWVYFAIFALFDLDDPPRTAEEISARLHISVEEAQAALKRLTDHALIELSSDGTYRPVVSLSNSLERLSVDLLRDAHEKNFRLALSTLALLKPSDHEFTTLTFAGSAEQIEAAKLELKRVRERIPAVMSSGSIDEIFQLNIQLYPLKNWHAPTAAAEVTSKNARTEKSS